MADEGGHNGVVGGAMASVAICDIVVHVAHVDGISVMVFCKWSSPTKLGLTPLSYRFIPY